MKTKDEQEMGKIKGDLQEIAKLIGPGRGYNQLLESGDEPVAIELPLGQVLGLLPKRLVSGSCKEEKENRKVTVFIRDLFNQMEMGQVTASIWDLSLEIPSSCLMPSYVLEGETSIEIPTEMIMRAMWREDGKN